MIAGAVRTVLFALILIGSYASAQGVVLPSSKNYQIAELYLQKVVKASLRDPDSAKFKPMYICAFSKSLKMAVALVNSKNAFGGYSGFQEALVMESDGVGRTMFGNPSASTLPDLDLEEKRIRLATGCLDRWREAAKVAGVPIK